MKNSNSNSWYVKVKALLAKYSLPSPFELIGNPPTKTVWKTLTADAIKTFWQDQWLLDQIEKSSLKYLNMKACKIGSPHHVWSSLSPDVREVERLLLKQELSLAHMCSNPTVTSTTSIVLTQPASSVNLRLKMLCTLLSNVLLCAVNVPITLQLLRGSWDSIVLLVRWIVFFGLMSCSYNSALTVLMTVFTNASSSLWIMLTYLNQWQGNGASAYTWNGPVC